jgi:signal transduction histidine kinase
VKKLSPVYYFYPALILFLIFLSVFLNAEIFKSPLQTFSAWFILSVFSFAIGWAIDKSFGWVAGGKIVFVTIIIAVVFSVALAIFFGEYFYIANPFLEDLLFFALRGITLGAMAFFGMSVAEAVRRETLCEVYEAVERESRLKTENAEKEAELIISEAKLEAEKIIRGAQAEAEALEKQSEELRGRLEVLISTEKEILKKYEDNKS